MNDSTNDGVFLWQSEAKCIGQPPAIFFLEEDNYAKNSFRVFCDNCPVKQACLEEGLVYGYSGVWGGTTDKDRRRIPRKQITMLMDDYEESGIYNRQLKA